MRARFNVLAIDNYDSFVHVLADEFRRRQCAVDVYRNHWPIEEALGYIRTNQPDLLLMSPGPGKPEDASLCLDLLHRAPRQLPVFGVCLGYQCIVHCFGGRVIRADEVVHGKPVLIRHRGRGVFQGLEARGRALPRLGDRAFMVGRSLFPGLCHDEALQTAKLNLFSRRI